ncbi:uncharacterized protein LOC129277455 [Lytechinus pictus]|uniref:uncharacterized protein LOC129277455 n=1 Tax=Lytechinus pictus TaxID=7653 RepID=UPI0030BA1C52
METKFSKFDGDTKKQYWLEPTAAALAKLEEIQSSVERMKPASSFNVQSVWHPASSTPPPASPSSSKPSPYTELETEPPLSTVSIQKTAWGSNNSIPDLIKAQGERQKQKGAPRRPWSGRKVPQSPTLQRKGAPAGGGDDSNRDTSGAFMAVKGAKSVMYDASSRPPSGRSHQSSSSSSTTVPHVSSQDVFDMMEAANTTKHTHGESGMQGEDNALEEFLRNQPNGHKHELSKLSAAYADERNITPPPPPPCASPDLEKLINGGLDEDNFYADVDEDEDSVQVKGHREKEREREELYIKQPTHVPPPLLRRPTPEPLKLSMTIPDAEGEEQYSTDEDRSSGAPSPQLSPDIEVQSVTSDVSTQLTAQYITSQQNSPVHTHPITPQGPYSTITQNREYEFDGEEVDVDARSSRKGRQSVKFVEERNVTFDITPRDCASSHKPSPPSVSKVQRPRSALKNTGARKSIVQKKRPSSAGSKGSQESANENSYSSGRLDHGFNEDHSNREHVDALNVTNDDILDAINNNGISQLLDNLSKSRKKQEVETMMSKLSVSEAQEATGDSTKATREVPQSDIVRTVQVSSSSSKTNYYEKAIQAKKKSMYHRQNTPTRTLTTKMIEFGDEGVSMETKEVSYFQTPPSQVKVSRPTSSRGPRRGWEEPGGSESIHVNRPTMGKKSFIEQQIVRPTSRLGSYQDLDDPDPQDLNKTSSASSASQRARPKSAVFKAKTEGGPHNCARGKSPNRVKPRPHSSFVNSDPPKKPMRRSSSPSAQMYSNSNKALVPTVRKSKAEVQRNREAVRALKDGSLKKTKTYGKQIVAVDDRMLVGRTLAGKGQQNDGKGSDSDSIDEYPKSMREEEVFNLHRHLTKSGVKVTYKALKKGLVAPDEKSINDCLEQLPSNVSLNLLSKPEAWLGETYRNYQIAENALRRAETQIAIQEERARMEAEKLEQSLKKNNGKKKKKKKGGKMRTKSSGSTRSTLSSAKSPGSAILPRSKVAEGDRPISAISALGLDPDEILNGAL